MRVASIDVRQVGLAVARQRRRHAQDDVVAVGDRARARGRLGGAPSATSCASFSDGTSEMYESPASMRRTASGETSMHVDGPSALGQRHRERKPHISRPDDCYARFHAGAEYREVHASAGEQASRSVRPHGRPPVQLGTRRRRRERRHGLAQRRRVVSHEHVPARLDRLDPLARVAQRHAGDAVQVRLLLHAARVGEAQPGAEQERREVDVAERLERTSRRPGTSSRPSRSSAAAGAGAAGSDDRLPERAEALHDAPSARLLRVRLAMHGGEQVAAGLRPSASGYRAGGRGRGADAGGDVDHDVPHDVHPLVDALARPDCRPPSATGTGAATTGCRR